MFYNRATTLDKGFVYIMASRRNGTLYVGVTNDLCVAWQSTRPRWTTASLNATA